MTACLSAMYTLIFLLVGVNAAGIGEAWQITPYLKSMYLDHPFWRRLDSSAFEVRTVSGVGRLAPFDESRNLEKHSELTTSSSEEQNALPQVENASGVEKKNLERFQKLLENSSYSDDEAKEDHPEDAISIRRMLRKTLMARILHADEEEEEDDNDEPSTNEARGIVRIRRQAENATSLEKISTTKKSVREARLNSPETWSTSVQPISVEFRHRIPLDQVIRQQQEEEEAAALSNSYRRHQAPRADFVTGQHHRRSYPEYRESRDMPIRNYDDYDQMFWYRNAIRDRDYEYPSYRRGYSYPYPDPHRYRMERDYYARLPNDQYYYDRYRDDDFDLYGKSRPTPKPRRIIYYATLPEVVRKPVDLRNYPRYDKTSVTRDGVYKRVPGNVDPGRYRYRQYGGYDPYAKRSSYYDRPYEYPEGDSRRGVRVSTKENLSSERKVSNLIAVRDNDGKLPWPVQIGTEVSIKDDERIPGRKIFGESNGGYDRFQSAQLQKAPDATGSSELQSDN